LDMLWAFASLEFLHYAFGRGCKAFTLQNTGTLKFSRRHSIRPLYGGFFVPAYPHSADTLGV
jgi:hypothetical protein